MMKTFSRIRLFQDGSIVAPTHHFFCLSENPQSFEIACLIYIHIEAERGTIRDKDTLNNEKRTLEGGEAYRKKKRDYAVKDYAKKREIMTAVLEKYSEAHGVAPLTEEEHASSKLNMQSLLKLAELTGKKCYVSVSLTT